MTNIKTKFIQFSYLYQSWEIDSNNFIDSTILHRVDRQITEDLYFGLADKIRVTILDAGLRRNDV